MENFIIRSAGQVYLGADNASYELKQVVREYLESLNFLVIDLGVFDIEEPSDDTVMGREVAEKVLDNQENCKKHDFKDNIHGCKVYGVLLSWSGLGMYTAATTVKNVKSALCATVEEVNEARKNKALILSVNIEGRKNEEVLELINKFVLNGS